jgi:hypothetical protein
VKITIEGREIDIDLVFHGLPSTVLLMPRLFTISIPMARSEPHKISTFAPVASIACVGSGTFTPTFTLFYTIVAPAKDSNSVFITIVVVEWLRLVNRCRAFVGPYTDSIVSLGLVPVSLIEHVSRNNISFMNDIVVEVVIVIIHVGNRIWITPARIPNGFGPQKSLPVMNCVVKGVVADRCLKVLVWTP